MNERRYQQKLKHEAMEAFGGKCIICGASDLSKLHLTHPNGDGYQHRTLISRGRGGVAFYRALRNREWGTDGFELVVMCISCHNIHDFTGSKSVHWGKKNEDAVTFKPESTNPNTKYHRHKRDPERFPMTEGDWQQYREYYRETRQRLKGVEV